jgi:hypothetical protein
MKDEIVKGIDEKIAYYKSEAEKPDVSKVVALANLSKVSGLSDAKVTVLDVLQQMLMIEHDELILEINEMIEKANENS